MTGSAALPTGVVAVARPVHRPRPAQPTSSTEASNQTTVAAACSSGTWNGRVTAAFATMPVPITEANQFGPRLQMRRMAGAGPGAARTGTAGERASVRRWWSYLDAARTGGGRAPTAIRGTHNVSL